MKNGDSPNIRVVLGEGEMAVCLEHEIRKAQINRASVVSVFFDIEKTYDMTWTDGLLIKLCKLGIKGQMYRRINNVLSGRAIKVNSYSEKFVIENGTPQGCIASPLLFSIMINDVFEDLDNGLGLSLFADDWAICRRNIGFIVKKLQEAMQ